MIQEKFNELKNNVKDGLYDQIYMAIEIYLPKIIGAIIIILIGFLIAFLVYKLVMYIFEKFKIIKLIDRLFLNLNEEIIEKRKQQEEEILESTETKVKEKIENIKCIKKKKISDNIKLDVITAKAFAYYIFLIFFRLAVVFIGIKEVEIFLGDLIEYLPSLFIAIIIGFFGVRFANFIYDLTFHALDLAKQKTAKIVASGSKIIILFFTLMVVLSKIGIATEITNTILIGFISMLAIAGGLAFGLGGKDIAHEILENFKK